jgi:hypothetical protein
VTRRSLLLAAPLLVVAGCGKSPTPGGQAAAPAGPPWLERADGDGGIDFTHDSGHRGRYLMPEIMGGGAALFDMDGDGDLDAYLVQGGVLELDPAERPGNQLFRNDGGGSFTDVTDGSGADDRGAGQGVTCGDFDNDGDVDIYVTNVGPNALLRNDGEGRFTDVTGSSGTGDDGWGTSSAFLDYDRDGDLDLFVCNYISWSVGAEIDCVNELGEADYCNPLNYDAPARDVLYRNEGDGTFTDVTEPAGLGTRFGTALGVVCGDFDGDGWIDVFVANDGMRDQLWVNGGDGTFVDDALLAGCAVDRNGRANAGMGVAADDWDGDDDLDIIVCHLRRESDALFRNDGGVFTDVTAAAGLGTASRPFTRFGMGWIDLDHDGAFDLYQANGRVMRQSESFTDDRFAEPNLVFRGTGDGRFEEVAPRGGTARPLYATSRAAAFGDVDGDGDVDVLVVNKDERAHLLLNVAPKQGGWLHLEVLDEHGRPALHATVRCRIGERPVRRDVRAGYSYLASNDPRIHLGLGDASVVGDIVVTWPDGETEAFPAAEPNQQITLRRGRGTP